MRAALCPCLCRCLISLRPCEDGRGAHLATSRGAAPCLIRGRARGCGPGPQECHQSAGPRADLPRLIGHLQPVEATSGAGLSAVVGGGAACPARPGMCSEPHPGFGRSSFLAAAARVFSCPGMSRRPPPAEAACSQAPFPRESSHQAPRVWGNSAFPTHRPEYLRRTGCHQNMWGGLGGSSLGSSLGGVGLSSGFGFRNCAQRNKIQPAP